MNGLSVSQWDDYDIRLGLSLGPGGFHSFWSSTSKILMQEFGGLFAGIEKNENTFLQSRYWISRSLSDSTWSISQHLSGKWLHMYWFVDMNRYEHITSNNVDFLAALAKLKIWHICLLFMYRQLGCRPFTCEINNHSPRYLLQNWKQAWSWNLYLN